MSKLRHMSRKEAREKDRTARKLVALPGLGEGRGFDLRKALLSDISEITLDVTEEMLGIEMNIPIGNNEAFAEYNETLDLDEVPDYLRRACKELSDACVRAVRERVMLQREVPCATCVGACCRASTIQLNASDIERLEAAGIDIEETVDNYDAEACSGHVAEFILIPDEIHFPEESGSSLGDAVCPYLRPEGCIIYEHRPTICREYSAWTCEAYVEDPDKKDGKVHLRVKT